MSYASVVLADSPVAYYRMGEASGSVVDATGGSSGTVSGTVTRDVAGALGVGDDGAIDFGGTNGYVSVPDQNKLDLGNGPFSLEFWIKRRGFGATRSVLDKGDGAYSIFFSGATNKIRFEKVTGGVVASETGSTGDSNWHHFVVTRSSGGTTTKVYKDGADVTLAVSSQTFGDTANALFIGSFHATTDYQDGVIDEVAIYNTALSSTQVAAHYAARNATDASIAATGSGAATALVVAGRRSSATATGGGTLAYGYQRGASSGIVATGSGALTIDQATARALAMVASGGGIADLDATSARLVAVDVTGGGTVTVNTQEFARIRAAIVSTGYIGASIRSTGDYVAEVTT